MGDATPAEETELRAACCQLFDSSMRSVARRLRTFQRWPQNSPVSAQELVEAGFFFVGPSDEVQCFCCGGVLKDWRPGDCPIMEHLNFFPSCKYICGEDVGNQNMFSLEGIFDTVDGQLLSVLQGIVSEDTALLSQPEYPEMIREEMRLSTFQNWPQHTNMQPEQLARAGFFYTGEDDVVRCFHCDGGVRNWSYGDDPWSEHAKWYPGCEFLLQSKGRVFVNSVRATFSTTLLTPRLSWDQTEQDSSPSQDAVERATGTSREERQSVQQKDSDESQLSAEEQLRRLREERTCKVCMDRDVSVVFVPCGHLVACGECALNLRLCPICRAVIQGSVRTFMS
ncbi:PREDICTED: baculoviral IAP repeat-containing protein 7 [Acanthisitta chloris]|uniref:baculoviral IAP repeat-containing protein 7 n=1 Tax=Acanthisitta chloris TaxID=57068 RepID=UPI0004F0D0FF|nr:PREDICTED: baculoviral IAP repeat-containing protein 7 [Acanthisitta chloris]